MYLALEVAGLPQVGESLDVRLESLWRGWHLVARRHGRHDGMGTWRAGYGGTQRHAVVFSDNSVALSGHQKHSEALRSTQRHSVALSGISVALSGTQKHSEALSGTQWHSVALRSTQKHSEALSGTQKHSVALSGISVALSGTQWHSEALSGTQWHSVAHAPATARGGASFRRAP